MATNASPRTFTAGEALAAYRLVKIESGTTETPPEIVYADSDEAFIGVTAYGVEDAHLVAVHLLNQSGTVEVEAGEAFAVGASLYVANDGKVVDTDPGSGTIRLIALDAAGAAGDVVECLIL